MLEVKTTIPPMLGRTEAEKQMASNYYKLACDYERQSKQDEATLLYREAARLGYPPAQTSLAHLYSVGAGVEYNLHLAFELYWQAASHGDALAQRELGRMYRPCLEEELDCGVEQSFEEFVCWTMTAAQTSPGACLDLADCCEGWSSLRDLERAKRWRQKADALEAKGCFDRDDDYPVFQYRRLSFEGVTGSLDALDWGNDKALFEDLPLDDWSDDKDSAVDSEFHAGGEPSGPEEYSHKKEFYRTGYLADRRFCAYGGNIYYLHDTSFSQPSRLCVSDPQGGNARVLAEVGDFDEERDVHITVNCTGIYLYTNGSPTGIHVQKYDLSGTLLGRHRMVAQRGKDDGDLYDFYIYGPMVYCTMARKDKTLILSLNTDTGETRTLYSRVSRIDRLSASADCLSFHALYEGKDGCDDGWMLYDLATGQVRCLSNSQCSPENVLSNPQYYDEDSPAYLECAGCTLLNVQWVDLVQGIFWTQECLPEDRTKTVWRARSISDGQLRTDIPMWVVDLEEQYSEQEYFDGKLHFLAPTYYKFVQASIMGTYQEWKLNNGGHGACDQFAVLDGYLYLNSNGYNEPSTIYQSALGKWEVQGTDWFANPL